MRPGAAHPASERTVVPAVTVDGLRARLRLGPTHLKIDVDVAVMHDLLAFAQTAAQGEQVLLVADDGHVIYDGAGVLTGQRPTAVPTTNVSAPAACASAIRASVSMRRPSPLPVVASERGSANCLTPPRSAAGCQGGVNGR